MLNLTGIVNARGRRRSSGRGGVALMIVLVSVAVLLVLALAITASISNEFDRILIAADGLYRFKTEINGDPPDFYDKVKAYPGHLIDLIVPITTSMTNSCGQLYSSSPNVNNWLGPYHLVPFNPANGYALSTGIVAQDATVRTTFTNGAVALAIVMNDVQLADAQALKSRIDGTSGDTIAFTPNGTNVIPVYYRIPITNNC
jgi:hypothetical protein